MLLLQQLLLAAAAAAVHSFGAAAAAAAAAATCRSPLNNKFETPCAETLASKGPVAIRKLGASQNVTLIATADLDAGDGLQEALEFGAIMLFKYFTASPGGQSGNGVVLNRTVPLTVRKDSPSAGGGWTLWMAASSAQFPDGPGQLPAPGKYEELQILPLPGSSQQGRAAYFAVVNFTTPSIPQEADWDKACALALGPGALPAPYVLDDSAPFPGPTLALYELADHEGPWVSECWVGVRPQ
jgi:hypothetical protein